MNIEHHPTPVLAQAAQIVNLPLSPEQRLWLDEMRQSMLQSNGVGIAAPQVGQSWQIMIVASKANARYPDAPDMPPLVMCNPQILSMSEEKEWGWEGCLSVPGKRAHIARAARLRVRYFDIEGGVHEQEFSGFVARIIQHECDHLQGICIVERVEKTEHLISESEYLALMA